MPPPRLHRVPGLPAYYLAATAARTGDEMVGVAVVLLVLARTGSAPLAGAVVAAYTLPTLASGPLLGAWLDRTRYRRAALGVNQALLATAMLGLVATTGSAPAWVPPALTALVGFTVPMTSAGFTSLLPRFVPAGLLPRAHAAEGVSFNASAILGPATSATVAAAVSPAAAVAAIAGVAVVSLGALVGLPAAVATAPARPDRSGLLTAVRDGLGHLARTPPLRAATAATSVAFLGMGMLTVALPLHAEALGHDPALGGYVWTAIEAGSVVTALAWGRWHARWRPERVVLGSLAAFGVLILGWPVAGSFSVLLALAVLAGLAEGAGLPALFSTRQRYTPDRLLARVSTTGASLKLAPFAGGGALAGVLVPLLGTPAVLLLVAGLQLAAVGTGVALLRDRAARPTVQRPVPPATGYASAGAASAAGDGEA